MLATLKKIEPSARGQLLASYVHDLLPNPGVETESSPRRYPDSLYQSLRYDIAKALRLGPEDTPENRQKILNFVFEQIRQVTVDTKKIKEVRDRVGQKGDLPLSAYQLKFSDSFSDLSEKMGVSRDMVRAAFKSPDSVDHLTPKGARPMAAPATSLITSTFRGDDPFVLLVLAVREKSTLRVDGAWLIYHSDVDLSGSYGATEVLRRFLQIYGLPLTVRESNQLLVSVNSQDRLILNRSFPVYFFGEPNFSVDVHSGDLESGQAGEHDVHFQFEEGPGVLEIGYVFAVNIVAYIDAMKRHGINVARKPAMGLEIRAHTEAY